MSAVGEPYRVDGAILFLRLLCAALRFGRRPRCRLEPSTHLKLRSTDSFVVYTCSKILLIPACTHRSQIHQPYFLRRLRELVVLDPCASDGRSLSYTSTPKNQVETSILSPNAFNRVKLAGANIVIVNRKVDRRKFAEYKTPRIQASNEKEKEQAKAAMEQIQSQSQPLSLYPAPSKHGKPLYSAIYSHSISKQIPSTPPPLPRNLLLESRLLVPEHVR